MFCTTAPLPDDRLHQEEGREPEQDAHPGEGRDRHRVVPVRHRSTTFEVDALGRTTKATYPNGRIDYTVFDDANHEVRFYAGWDSTNNVPTGPTVVTRKDLAGGYTETLTMSAAPGVSSIPLTL